MVARGKWLASPINYFSFTVPLVTEIYIVSMLLGRIVSSTHLELLLLLLISLLLLKVVTNFLICLLYFLAQYFLCSIWVLNVVYFFRVVI